MVDSHRPTSQFWNSIQKVKWAFGLGAQHIVHSGSSKRLWRDWWQGSRPLSGRFSNIFAITVEPDATVARSWDGEAWQLTFHRELGFGERIDLANLPRVMEGVFSIP
jgi:hypothetical protein